MNQMYFTAKVFSPVISSYTATSHQPNMAATSCSLRFFLWGISHLRPQTIFCIARDWQSNHTLRWDSSHLLQGYPTQDDTPQLPHDWQLRQLTRCHSMDGRIQNSTQGRFWVCSDFFSSWPLFSCRFGKLILDQLQAQMWGMKLNRQVPEPEDTMNGTATRTRTWLDSASHASICVLPQDKSTPGFR